MTISGQFRNKSEQIITVTFTKDTNSNENIVIGDNGLFFAENPVTIQTNNENTFNVIIRKSATIRLLTNRYIGNILFADNARSVKVEIKQGNNYLFYGFVDPNTFSQPYTSPLDDFEINCIDVLSTLQYYNYKNITVNNFDEMKQAATNVSFKSIIDGMFNNLGLTIYYDNSKGISSNRTANIFSDLQISELIMLGESADDVWTYEDLLKEMLQYLNLHIIQDGKNCFIFDWDSIKDN